MLLPCADAANERATAEGALAEVAERAEVGWAWAGATAASPATVSAAVARRIVAARSDGRLTRMWGVILLLRKRTGQALAVQHWAAGRRVGTLRGEA